MDLAQNGVRGGRDHAGLGKRVAEVRETIWLGSPDAGPGKVKEMSMEALIAYLGVGSLD